MEFPKDRIAEIRRTGKSAACVPPIRHGTPPASVLVVGSVLNPTAVTWQKGRNGDYYLDQSGGLPKDA